MAELLIARGFQPPDMLAVRLREELPDDLWVVVGPQVQGHQLEVVIITAQGLVALHRDDQQRRRDESEPAEDQADQAALMAFLADEFPTLRPPIRHVRVSLRGGPDLATGDSTFPVSLDNLAATLGSLPWPAEFRLARSQQAELAHALVERRLTRSQRAEKPFLLRTAGLAGTRQAWTVAALVRRLDQVPEDGVFHLRDGSLSRWLDDQGAAHLARLAREVVRELGNDPRIALEQFLIGTGLVTRPIAHVTPTVLHLGTVAAGEAAMGKFTIRRGRGRGYLHGELHSSQPWLSVEPDHFSGDKLEVSVRVETADLPIQVAPHHATILLAGSPWAQPLPLTVSVRVGTIPSRLNRRLVRPALGAAVGAATGVLPAWAAAGLSTSLPRLADVGAAGVLGAVVLLWAVGGALTALRRRRLPTLGALAGESLRLLLLAAAVLFGLGFVGGVLLGVPTWQMGMTAAGLAILAPALTGKRAPVPTRAVQSVRPRQPLTGLPEIVLALLVIVVILVAWLRPASLDLPLTAAEQWLDRRLAQVEQRVNDLWGQWLLQRYDRRAPEFTPLRDLPGAEPDITERAEMEAVDMHDDTQHIGPQQAKEGTDEP